MADAKHMTVFIGPRWRQGTGPSFTNTALNASDLGWGIVGRAAEAATITHCGFRYGARSGTPPSYVLTVEGVDSSGLPSGADLGGGSPTAKVFTPPADTTWNGTFRWIELTNPITLARNDPFAITVKHSSGTIDGSNNSSLSSNYNGALSVIGLPYYVSLASGVWSKTFTASNGGGIVFGLKSASKVYGYPVANNSNRTLSTSGNRVACKFKLPGSGTYKVLMARFHGLTPAGSGTYGVGIWNGTGTFLQGGTGLDSDFFFAAATDNQIYEVTFPDASLATLNFGTTYYVGLQAAGSNVTLRTADFTDANDATAYELGADTCYSSWNGSAWTDVTTARVFCELVLDDISSGISHLIGGGLVQ